MSVLTDCVCWVVTLPVDKYIYVLDAWWRKQFSRCWPFVRGIHRSLVNSPRKGQWRGALMFFFICAWANGWVNHRRLFETPSQSLWRHCNDESFCDCLIGIEAVDALLPNGRRAINDKDGDSAATNSTSLVYPSNNEIRFPQYQCSNPEEYDDVTKWKHFRVTGHLCWEFSGHRWIPRTKASDAVLWSFLWSIPESTIQ